MSYISVRHHRNEHNLTHSLHALLHNHARQDFSIILLVNSVAAGLGKKLQLLGRS